MLQAWVEDAPERRRVNTRELCEAAAFGCELQEMQVGLSSLLARTAVGCLSPRGARRAAAVRRATWFKPPIP